MGSSMPPGDSVYRERMYCMTPECRNWSTVRGLCHKCYKSEKRLVEEGLATWDQLMEKGCILPPKHGGRKPSLARKWCLEALAR